jgi:hypothetical protein
MTIISVLVRGRTTTPTAALPSSRGCLPVFHPIEGVDLSQSLARDVQGSASKIMDRPVAGWGNAGGKRETSSAEPRGAAPTGTLPTGYRAFRGYGGTSDSCSGLGEVCFRTTTRHLLS